MKVLIGLGNPGAEYAATRHNAGVMLVDKIQESEFRSQGGYGWRRKKDIVVAEFADLILVKTASVFMNESGRIVRELEDMSDLYVAHDDLDIKLGEYKVQFGRGPREHGGISSVESVVGKGFWRVRIGVDNRQRGSSGLQTRVLDSRKRGPAARARIAIPALSTDLLSGEEYVLGKFLPEEREVLDRVLDEIVKANFRRKG